METSNFAKGPLLVVFVLLTSTGCGAHYWQRPGGTVQEFDRDSLVCVEEARAAKYGIGAGSSIAPA